VGLPDLAIDSASLFSEAGGVWNEEWSKRSGFAAARDGQTVHHGASHYPPV